MIICNYETDREVAVWTVQKNYKQNIRRKTEKTVLLTTILNCDDRLPRQDP